LAFTPEHHLRHTAQVGGSGGAGLSGWLDDRKRAAPGSETRPTCHRADGGKRLHDLGQNRTNEATMPPRRKSARLWLRPEATKNGRLCRRATWLIIDGGRHFSTGCLAHEIEKAERKLAEHVALKYQPSRKERDIELIDVADVLAIYLDDTGSRQ